MLTRGIVALAAGLAVGIAACPVSAAPRYAAIPLGTLGSSIATGLASSGYGINASGQVTGWSDLDIYVQHSSLEVRAINDSGQIVANGYDAQSGRPERAYRLDPVIVPPGGGGGGCAMIEGARDGSIDPTLPLMVILAVAWAFIPDARSRNAELSDHALVRIGEHAE